jgi:serine/threonine protein kinase
MSDEDPMIGLKLGNYEITQKLAQGGMGIIYQARHTTLNRIVAIKFLASHFSEEKEYVERFLREARAAALLNHPNIISVYDAGVADDVYYLIMEYVKGQNLSVVLQGVDSLEEDKCVRLMHQAASALSYAHSEGIIHHDVKPQNLILTPEDQLKICDLGLATLMSEKGDSLLGEGEVIGTPYYISPEQVQDSKSVDARTDIYSLGATFYHLLTGHPPFRGESNDEIMTKHLTEPFPSPREIKASVSEGMCFVLSKMMARDLSERYQTMNELIEHLVLLEAGKSPVKKAVAEIQTNDALFQSKMTNLQRRLMGKTDFPSMSGTMGVITKLVSVTDNTTVNELAEAILSDFALTNKILKLVNSVFYSGFGEKIGTISQAIMVLGLGQVRNAALSLMLFENLQNRPLAKEIKESSISNYLSGVIAKNFAIRLRVANREEAFIAAIFHNLGKLLVTFYLPEDRQKINDLLANDKILTDETASRSVLGQSYEHFGMRVGKDWNFPEQIILTMERLPEDPELPKPKTMVAQLHCIVSFSNALCAILRNNEMNNEEREAKFQELINRFKNCFPMTLEEMAETIDISLEELTLFTKSLDMKVDVDSMAS